MKTMNHLMQRCYQNDFDAMRAAEAGMIAGGELVTNNPMEPQNLEFGRQRVYWRVLDDDHINRIDDAISVELYGVEEVDAQQGYLDFE